MATSVTVTVNESITTDTSNITFILNDFVFDTSFILPAEVDVGVSGELVGDVLMNASINIEDISGIFKFQTDSSDITDVATDDILYKQTLDETFNGIFATSVVNSITNGNGSGITDGLPLSKEYIEFIAENVFNVRAAVDLFSNEVDLNDGIKNGVKTDIETFLDSNTKQSYDNSNNPIDEGGVVEISRKLLETILRLDGKRVKDNITQTVEFQNIPLKVDDIIVVKVNINDSNTHANEINNKWDAGASGSGSVRSYIIKIKIVEPSEVDP